MIEDGVAARLGRSADTTMTRRGHVAWIVEGIGPFKFSAVVVFGLVLGAAVFETLSIAMIMPLLQAFLTSDGTAGPASTLLGYGLAKMSPRFRLLAVCVLTLVVLALKALFVIGQTYYSSRFGNRLREYWSQLSLETYLLGTYGTAPRQGRGQFTNNIIHEPIYVSKALRDVIEFVASAIISACLVVLLVSVSWRMTLVVAVVSGLAVLLVWRLTARFAADTGKRRTRLNQEVSQMAVEAVSGARQLKIFSAEPLVIREFGKRLRQLTRLNNRFTVMNTLPRVLAEVLIGAVLVGFLLFYHYGLGADVASVLPLVGVFVLGSLRLLSSISELLAVRMRLISYLPSIEVVHTLALPSDGASRPSGDEEDPIRIRESIRFDGVTYRFGSDDEELLSDLCVEFRYGTITGIVGASGSGKSTFCDLLSSLCRPTGGRILVDGVDLARLKESSWRRQIGYVSQESFIFDATVRENIMLGRPDATEADLIQAVEQADAREFIEKLPCGYDTLLGDHGASLSGGQRQRLAIARVFLRDPAVLIFDEATNELDVVSEGHILESLRSMARNKIVLFITHRLSSLWVTDFIYFVDSGKVVESGPYEELLARRGAFWKFVNHQQNEQGESSPAGSGRVGR